MPESPQDKFLVEAILLGSPDPVSINELRDRLPAGADVMRCLQDLVADYEGRSITVVEVAGGWTVRTKPEHSDLCRATLPKPPRLSKAALETLAVIACFQPVTRPEIERVRGVSLAKGTLDLLIWAGWVRPAGRRQTPGNPLTFMTTDAFLRQFSLDGIDNFPGLQAMRDEELLDAQIGIGIQGGENGITSA